MFCPRIALEIQQYWNTVFHGEAWIFSAIVSYTHNRIATWPQDWAIELWIVHTISAKLFMYFIKPFYFSYGSGKLNEWSSLIFICSLEEEHYGFVHTVSFWDWQPHLLYRCESRNVPFTQCVCSKNAVVSPKNLRVWVRLQNTVVTPVNNLTVCEHNRINTWLITVFCCCVNVLWDNVLSHSTLKKEINHWIC